MPAILEIRENIIGYYRRYEQLIRPAAKFVAALLAMADINGRIGYEENLTGILPVLLVALLSSLLPCGGIIAILGIVIMLHLYALSLEAALIGLFLLVLLLLLYFQFGPKDGALLVAAPMSYMFGMPYTLPIAGGLLYHPGSAVTVAIAAIVHSYLTFVSENEAAIVSAASDEDVISRFRFVIDGIMQNKTLLVMAAAAAIALLVVLIVRRLPIPYAWYLAVGAGGLVQLIVILIGDMVYATNISIVRTFLGVIGALIIGAVMTFFLFHLDYSRIENVQFEDEDYYYYVKAVPKITYRESNRTVKTISTSRHVRTRRQAEYQPEYDEAAYAEGSLPQGYPADGIGDDADIVDGITDDYGADGYDDYENPGGYE